MNEKELEYREIVNILNNNQDLFELMILVKEDENLINKALRTIKALKSSKS
jgi:hypothetical protein